ncbi:hypothetical protein [Bacillus phage SDFMU_Pbc]|uniref:Uncharacterized protein n=1 Tax=Bacillus phage SDFMU_Pbc TaxID=3076135 RepID=A0AA96R1B6_9CAUD|nr:hypothetical protein [Bacillus phage SDFMU_Pbc]
MTKQQTADSLNEKELRRLVMYLMTGKLADESQQKLVKNTLRKVINVADVVTIARAVTSADRQLVQSLIDHVNVQHKVIERLDPTGALFEDAREEYMKELAEADEIGDGDETLADEQKDEKE